MFQKVAFASDKDIMPSQKWANKPPQERYDAFLLAKSSINHFTREVYVDDMRLVSLLVLPRKVKDEKKSQITSRMIFSAFRCNRRHLDILQKKYFASSLISSSFAFLKCFELWLQRNWFL